MINHHFDLVVILTLISTYIISFHHSAKISSSDIPFICYIAPLACVDEGFKYQPILDMYTSRYHFKI